MSESSKQGRRKQRQTKDRVLQARIPEQLDEELRDRAEQLGLSVSSIVRNVLLNTFDLVEGVVADSAQIARAMQGREKTAADAEAEVIGWQEATLNRNAICQQCNAILPMGERAAVGVPVQASPVVLCLDCLAQLSTPTNDPGASA
ncbi:MAG: hypothetical protein ABJ308_19125 [Halieaceae bacterium]